MNLLWVWEFDGSLNGSHGGSCLVVTGKDLAEARDRARKKLDGAGWTRHLPTIEKTDPVCFVTGYLGDFEE